MRPSLGLTALTLLLAHVGHAQSLAWAKQFNGTLNTVDWASELVVDKAGNSYVLGTTNVNLDQSYSDILLLKYSPSGALLWQKTYDGEAHSQDTAFDLALSPDGYVFVVGRTITPTTSSDYVTLKYRTDNGALVWGRTFDGPANSIDEALGVATDSLGNVYVTGEVWSDHAPYSNGDYCTLKYDSAGTLVWSSYYNGPANFISVSDQPHSIVVDHNGDVIVSGDSPDINSASRIGTVKYRGTDGAQLWVLRSETMPLSGYQVGLKVASNNDVVVAGNSQDFGLQVFLTRVNGITGAPIYTMREAFPHGGRLGSRASFELGKDDSMAIAVTYDPDTDNSNLNYNIQTTRYRFSDGGKVWSTSFGNSVKYDGQTAQSVTFDPSGNVVVAGSNLHVPNNVATAWRFSGATGTLLWTGEYNGPKQPDSVTRVRTDAWGNILMLGITGVDVGTGDSDVQLVKFGTKVLLSTSPIP